MQSNQQSLSSKTTSSGLPKITYDTAKQRSNISEVERLLNFYVQQRFKTLNDCIATRKVVRIVAPVAPSRSVPATPAVQPTVVPTTIPSAADESIASRTRSTLSSFLSLLSQLLVHPVQHLLLLLLHLSQSFLLWTSLSL